jgi:hypothetical protein
MVIPGRCLSVLVLTEDSASDSHDVIATLTKKTFQMIVEGCQTHRIEFQPADALAKQATRGTQWKSARVDRVSLVRTIANKLLEAEPQGFVVFHIDGDRSWRERSHSENHARFGQLIEQPVRDLIHGLRGEAAADQAMERLFLLIPFYSIEAWLFQNLDRLRRLCQTQYAGRDLETVATWEADRGLLDEIWKPKAAICVKAQHNVVLAEGFPADEAYGVGKSYTEVVDQMMVCAVLETALLATMHSPY